MNFPQSNNLILIKGMKSGGDRILNYRIRAGGLGERPSDKGKHQQTKTAADLRTHRVARIVDVSAGACVQAFLLRIRALSTQSYVLASSGVLNRLRCCAFYCAPAGVA